MVSNILEIVSAILAMTVYRISQDIYRSDFCGYERLQIHGRSGNKRR